MIEVDLDPETEDIVWLILNTKIFISSRFQIGMRTKKTVGTTIRNFCWLFHGADRGGKLYRDRLDTRLSGLMGD